MSNDNNVNKPKPVKENKPVNKPNKNINNETNKPNFNNEPRNIPNNRSLKDNKNFSNNNGLNNGGIQSNNNLNDNGKNNDEVIGNGKNNDEVMVNGKNNDEIIGNSKNNDEVIGDSKNNDEIIGGNKNNKGKEPESFSDKIDDAKENAARKLVDPREKVPGFTPSETEKNLTRKTRKIFKNIGRAKKLATGGAYLYASYMLAKLVAFFKMMLAKIIAAAKGFLATIVAFISKIVGFVATVLSVSSAIASFIFALFTVSAVGAVAFTVTSFIQNDNLLKSDTNNCVPDNTTLSVDTESTMPVDDMAKETISQTWSVFNKLGVRKEIAASIMGNWEIESGLDPTSVETIYTERFHLGPRKLAAESVDFDVTRIDASYGKKYPAIKQVGIGLGQWTNDRNKLLTEYAKQTNSKWYDPGVQLAFMISKDTRAEYLSKFLKDTSMSISEATNDYLIYWEGNKGDKVKQRTESAARMFLEIDNVLVDDAYAEGILSNIELSKASDNSLTANKLESDGCDGTVGDHLGSSSSYTGDNAVVKLAMDQIGKSYVWGASGPNTFDCSGLIYYIYKENGYNHSRTTAQGYYDLSRKIDKSEAKPGDLIFFKSGAECHHVGLYIGDDKMLHAPQTGDVVKIVDLKTYNQPIYAWGRLELNKG